MAFALLWQSRGSLKWLALPRGVNYLGRLPSLEWSKLSDEKVGGDPVFGVYIYSPQEGEPHYTGFSSPLVSRMHTLLEVNNTTVVVRDHGPAGKGSKNGTYVNSTPIARGGQVVLEKGTPADIRLGSLGPVFTLAVLDNSGSLVIPVAPGLPLAVPARIARELDKAGVLEEALLQGEEAVIVMRMGESVFSVDYNGVSVLIRPAEKLPFLAGVPPTGLSHGESLRLRLVGELTRIVSVSAEASVVTDLRQLAKVLRMDSYKKLLRGLGEDVWREYEQLLFYLDSGHVTQARKRALYLIEALTR